MAKIIETAEDVKLAQRKDNYNSFMKLVRQGNAWNLTDAGMLGVKAAMSMISTKTGMYARIPIYCKGKKCPYEESCPIYQNGLAPEGEACPIEIALIGKKWNDYSDQFELSSEDASPTDRALVEEIITMELYMERCRALMSKEVSPIQEVVVGISEQTGEAITQPKTSETIIAYEKFSKKRNEDYGLLMATRKDKSKVKVDNKNTDNMQSMFDLIEKAQKMPGFYTIEERPQHVS